MSIYSKDRVIAILDNILSRTEEKQNNKLKQEINEEIENKKLLLKKSIIEK